MQIIFLRLYHSGWTFHEQQDSVFSVVCVCVCIFLCVSDRSVVSYSTNDSHLPLAAVEEEDWSSNILSNWSISVSCHCCTSLDVAALTNGGSDDKCRTSGKELGVMAMVHEEGDEEPCTFPEEDSWVNDKTLQLAHQLLRHLLQPVLYWMKLLLLLLLPLEEPREVSAHTSRAPHHAQCLLTARSH